MLRITKIIALTMAAMILFSTFAFSENVSSKYYLVLEDPFFTDGETEYDLSGMKVELQLQDSPSFEQILLSVITAKGTSRAAVEIDTDTASIYGDGFTASYTMTIEYLLQILSETYGVDFNIGNLLDSDINTDAFMNQIAGIDLTQKEIIDMLYVSMLESVADLAETAPTETIDTFVYTGIEAKAIDFIRTSSEIDALCKPIFEQFDNLIAENSAYTGVQAESLLEMYETTVKPLNLSLDGKIYVSDGDVYCVYNIYTHGQLLTTAYFEITSGDSSAVYLNVPIDDGTGNKMTIYVTAEANANGDGGEYFEMGITDGETPSLLAISNAVGDSVEVYFGIAMNSTLIELNAKYTYEENTKRALWLSLNANGVMFELNYAGKITVSDNSWNERADMALTSNTGAAAKLTVEFGTAPFDAVSIIPSADKVPVVDMGSITPEQNAQLQVDFSNLLTQTMIILQYGVPGFSTLLEQLSPAIG